MSSTALFFSFSVLAPSASFVETIEPFASFSVVVVMSQFVPQVQIPVLVQLGVRWEQSRVEGSVLIPELVIVPVVVVPVPVEWFGLYRFFLLPFFPWHWPPGT